MPVVDLTRHFRSEAIQHARRLAQLLGQGRGFDGRRIPQKDRPDGDVLGGSIRRRLRRGRVSSSRGGFQLSYRQQPLVVRFHRGRKGQEQRPVVGLDAKDEQAIEERAADEAARQLQAAIDRL